MFAATRRRLLSAAGTLAAVAAGVYACTAVRSEPPHPPAPTTLEIGTALPRAGVSGAGVGAVIQRLLGEPLLGTDRVGRVFGRLCEKWEWAAEGRILRLTLLANVRFHDGGLLTPDVAVDILRTAFKRGGPLSFASVSKLVAVQPNTIDIHLSRIEAFLPSDIAEIPMVQPGSIGTGPFRLESPNGTTLTSFTDYYQGRPAINRVEVKPYPTLRSAWTAMMRGDINMLYEVSAEAADFVEQEPSVRSYPFLRPYYYLVAFNVRHPVLGKREVRQALSQAVDREAVVRDAMDGRGEPADGPVWKYFWAYSGAERTFRYNLEAARLRLDSAGFPVRSGAKAVMPSRLQFTCLMYGEDPRFERVALVLQKQLYDVGVDMRIESLPLERLTERIQAGQFDAFLLEFVSGRSLSWPYRVWHSRPAGVPGPFDSGYRAADAVLDRLRHAITEVDTRQGVGELQRIMFEDPPALFLAWPQSTRAVSATIEVPKVADTDIVGRIAQFGRPAAGTGRQP